MRLPKVTLCCVIEDSPRLRVELVLWVLCVQTYLPADRYTPVVYFVGPVPTDLRAWIKDRGVETREATPLVVGSPHSNKILPFHDSGSDDLIAVCDLDLYFVDDPSSVLTLEDIQAPPNNHGLLPPEVWHRVLGATTPTLPYRPGVALLAAGVKGLRETHINNINAGFVLSPSNSARALADAWGQRAIWLAIRREILGTFGVHVDQVSFALAMEDICQYVRHLPPQSNIILHLLETLDVPYAFHLSTGHIPSFPQRFFADRTLSTFGLTPRMAAGVERLNACILQAVPIIMALSSTKDHLSTFMNPQWKRA